MAKKTGNGITGKETKYNQQDIINFVLYTPRFSSVVYPGADKLKLHIDSKFMSDSVKQCEKTPIYKLTKLITSI